MAFNSVLPPSSPAAALEAALLAVAIGPAVKAAIRDNRETCAADRGANISYETLEEDDLEGRATGGGDDTAEDAMVGWIENDRRCLLLVVFGFVSPSLWGGASNKT